MSSMQQLIDDWIKHTWHNKFIGQNSPTTRRNLLYSYNSYCQYFPPLECDYLWYYILGDELQVCTIHYEQNIKNEHTEIQEYKLCDVHSFVMMWQNYLLFMYFKNVGKPCMCLMSTFMYIKMHSHPITFLSLQEHDFSDYYNSAH